MKQKRNSLSNVSENKHRLSGRRALREFMKGARAGTRTSNIAKKKVDQFIIRFAREKKRKKETEMERE